MRKLIAIILLLTAISAASAGVCDNRLVFILCDPKTPVNVRISPDNRATVVGRLDFGDYAESDGKQKNGFVHVFAGDAGDGWMIIRKTILAVRECDRIATDTVFVLHEYRQFFNSQVAGCAVDTHPAAFKS